MRAVLPSPAVETVAIWVLPTLLFCFGVAKCAVLRHYRDQ